MWYAAIAAVAGLLLADTARAEAKPLAFQDITHIACSEQQMAVYLLTVFEEDRDLGEMLLTELATRGRCERATFSGTPVADIYPKHHTGNLREGHVFEVDVTSGEVLKGRSKVYVLLYVLHDNES